MSECKYLSTPEAARYVGLGASSLERLRIAGSGPIYFRPTPRRVLYATDELDAWLRARKHASTSEYAPAQP
jgi:predicted DNA-binding transcriptional regulator AlpA